jgi:hypothetical protein
MNILSIKKKTHYLFIFNITPMTFLALYTEAHTHTHIHRFIGKYFLKKKLNFEISGTPS